MTFYEMQQISIFFANWQPNKNNNKYNEHPNYLVVNKQFIENGKFTKCMEFQSFCNLQQNNKLPKTRYFQIILVANN